MLRRVTTATIPTLLLQKGLRHGWLKGALPHRPGGKRLVGPAFPLRLVPARADDCPDRVLKIESIRVQQTPRARSARLAQ